MGIYKKSYYIGIDGGATKTVICLGDDRGEIQEVIKLGGSNYHTSGIKKTKNVIEEGIENMILDHNMTLNNIKGICFGGAGVDSSESTRIITKIFRDIGYKNELKVYNDGVIALVGANGDYDGGVIIGGTGSVGIGVDESLRLHKVGGWGHILDDKGSGYMIGKEALSKIMESYDGRGVDTMLWEKIRSRLEISSQEEISDFVYDKNTKKHHIARLAPIVIGLYDIDEVAKNIVDDAIMDLERLVAGLTKKMKSEKFSLGLYGSIILKNEIVKSRLIQRINRSYPDIDIHLPYDKAYVGALNIAMGKVKISD